MSSNRKDPESSSTTCLNQSKMLYLQFGKRNRQTDQKEKNRWTLEVSHTAEQ